MDQQQAKEAVARAALDYLVDDTILGVGSGSTVHCLIEALGERRKRIRGAVASSEETARRLEQAGIQVHDLNNVEHLPVYVDGADEINDYREMIKGGGGALTREKIVAAVAREFVCIVDDSKRVKRLGRFPLPVEVIPMARSHVARKLVALGGQPEYREDFVTDNGNIVLDVHNLEIDNPIRMEEAINNIVGVVTNGLFAQRPADQVIAPSML